MKHKLVCFDLDGTLVEGIEFSWQLIHDYLKTDKDKRNEIKKKFYNKEISYIDWATGDVELWKKQNVTKDQLIKALEKVSIMPGALELIDFLKKNNIKIGVISGSMDFILDYLFPNHPFDFLYIHKFQFDSKNLLTGIKPSMFDFEHKATALIEVSKKLNIPLEDTVFIGDNLNDIEIAQTAGLSIAFNSNSEELSKVSDIVIEKKDMKEIIKFLK